MASVKETLRSSNLFIAGIHSCLDQGIDIQPRWTDKTSYHVETERLLHIIQSHQPELELEEFSKASGSTSDSMSDSSSSIFDFQDEFGCPVGRKAPSVESDSSSMVIPAYTHLDCLYHPLSTIASRVDSGTFLWILKQIRVSYNEEKMSQFRALTIDCNCLPQIGRTYRRCLSCNSQICEDCGEDIYQRFIPTQDTERFATTGNKPHARYSLMTRRIIWRCGLPACDDGLWVSDSTCDCMDAICSKNRSREVTHCQECAEYVFKSVKKLNWKEVRILKSFSQTESEIPEVREVLLYDHACNCGATADILLDCYCKLCRKRCRPAILNHGILSGADRFLEGDTRLDWVGDTGDFWVGRDFTQEYQMY